MIKSKLLICLLLATFLGSSAFAKTYTISNGNVYGSNGLIAAIKDAMANGNATNTIILANNGLYQLNRIETNAPENKGPLGLPVIDNIRGKNQTLIIQGNNATIQRASGAPAFRLFYLELGTKMVLNNLTLKNGFATAYGGGAIAVKYQGELDVNNCRFENNQTGVNAPWGGAIASDVFCTVELRNSQFINNRSHGEGGAVYGVGTDLLIDQCRFVSNVSSSPNYRIKAGGAVFSDGSSDQGLKRVLVTNSHFENNSVGSNGIDLAGGGLYIFLYGKQTFKMNNCTVINNNASNYGGGLYIGTQTRNGVEDTYAEVNNSLFDDNQAGVAGGGIWLEGQRGLFTNCTISNNESLANAGGISLIIDNSYELRHCTIVYNKANGNNAGISSQNGSRVKLFNNIIAFNTGNNTGANCRQVYQGNNNIQFPEKKGNNSTLCVNNPIIKDPKLGSLKNNGGPTKTFALLAGSPAINAGDNNRSSSTDQRGVSRVGKSDIGAFEYTGGSNDPDPDPEPQPIGNEGNLSITTKITGNGSIQLSPSGPYTAGQTVTVTAQPGNGASFKEFRWGFGGLITQNNPYVLSISKNVTIEAIFEGGNGGGTDPEPDPDPNPNPGNINITTKVNGNGSIQLSPQGPYSSGQNVTVKAVPASGASFKDLRWGFGGLITTNDTYVFSISKNVTIQATFEGGNGGGTDPDPEPDPDPNPNPGNINITTRVNGDGNIQLSPQGPYSSGQKVTVTGVPDNGASFINFRWGFGGLITTNSTYVFNISKNVTIEANFSQSSGGGTDPDPNPNPGNLTITTKTDGNGSIQLSPQGPYSQGQQVTVTAVPNNGFVFNDFRWGFGGLISTNNPYVFDIQNNVTIQASFNAQGGGGTDPDPDPNPGSGAFIESNGQVIINVPSVGLNANSSRAWRIQSIGGQNYYQTKEGQNSFNKLTTYGIITYPISINTPGIYRVMMKSKINKSNRTDEHNDMWLKLPNNANASFFAFRGNVSSEQTLQNALNANNVLWPKGIGKTPNPAGASTSGYLKVYTNKIGPAYVMKTNDGPGHEIYVKFNKSGTYNLQIAHRSDGFAVRRLAMWKVNTYGDAYNKNGRNGLNSLDSQPQSSRAGNKSRVAQSTNSFNELIKVTQASPNPIKGEQVELQLSAPFQGTLIYAVYNTLGQLIDQKELYVEQAQSHIKLDLQGLTEKSVHYLKVQGSGVEEKVIRVVE